MYKVRAVKNESASEFISSAGSLATFPATMAAANSGKTSIELRCAPRARQRWFQSSAGSLLFHVSRFVRGLHTCKLNNHLDVDVAIYLRLTSRLTVVPLWLSSVASDSSHVGECRIQRRGEWIAWTNCKAVALSMALLWMVQVLLQCR